MVEARRPQYAQSDGLHVAYQVLGQGPPDMLFLSGVIPVDMFDDQPSIARFQRRLATFCRFVRFNPRGLGLSDPVSPAKPLTLEQHEQLQPMLAAGEKAGEGSVLLRDRLFTLPTHSRVGSRDMARLQDWLVAPA